MSQPGSQPQPPTRREPPPRVEFTAQEYQEHMDGNMLYYTVDMDKVYGLNLTVPEDARMVIKPWEARDDIARFCESNVDDQLILHVAFIEAVTMRSIMLKVGRGETAPQRLRLYVNAPPSSDFDDLEARHAHLDLALQQGEAGVVEYPLRSAAFTNAGNIALFFSDAEGGEQTRIYYVGFRGLRTIYPRQTTDGLTVHDEHATDADVERMREKAGGQTSTIK